MQRFLRTSFAFGLFGVASLLGSTALAAPAAPVASAPAASAVALAERYAEEAFEAYARKDHRSAVALYLQALEAAPSADIIYNLARVYDLGLQDRPLAIRFYTRYLDDPGAVANRIETARQRVAELTALEQAEHPQEPAKPVPPAAPAATAAHGESATPALAITAGALGLVGMGVGIGFGIAAKSDLDVSRRYCDDNSCTTLRGVQAARSAARAADVATVGFAAGGALLALGTMFWLIAEGEAEAAPAARGLELTPSVSPTQVSLGLAGSFAGL